MKNYLVFCFFDIEKGFLQNNFSAVAEEEEEEVDASYGSGCCG